MCRRGKESQWKGGCSDDESSTTRIDRAVLTDNGIVGQGIGVDDDGGLQLDFLYVGSKNIFCVKEG